jgi:hypothetical protein
MGIATLANELKSFVDESRTRLEKILDAPVREYLEANITDPEWFAAMMHNTGSEADEAIRLATVAKEFDREELTKAVVHRLAAGIISTTLMPSVLPSTLLTSTNQAVLACLRDAADGEMHEN